MECKLKPMTYLDISGWDYDRRQLFYPHDFNVRTYRIVFMDNEGYLDGYSGDQDERCRWLKQLSSLGYKPLPKCNSLGRM